MHTDTFCRRRSGRSRWRKNAKESIEEEIARPDEADACGSRSVVAPARAGTHLHHAADIPEARGFYCSRSLQRRRGDPAALEAQAGQDQVPEGQGDQEL